jgi:toxin ParE1/3/4
MGSVLELRRPEFCALRKWRIRDFDNFLFFYEPQADGVSIVRALRATQDWWQLFGVGSPL